MQWHTQAGNLTTNLKVKIDLSYLNLARQKSLRGIAMWMPLLRAVIILY